MLYLVNLHFFTVTPRGRITSSLRVLSACRAQLKEKQRRPKHYFGSLHCLVLGMFSHSRGLSAMCVNKSYFVRLQQVDSSAVELISNVYSPSSPKLVGLVSHVHSADLPIYRAALLITTASGALAGPRT